MSLPPVYSVSHTTPSVPTYTFLRTSSGLTPFTTAAAEKGLPNTLFFVQIMHSPSSSFPPEPIGMGRITGDGGCFFLVTDICVLPIHQKKGLGKAIMRELVQWLEANAPKSAYVSLGADGEAKRLYEQFGFRLQRETDTEGMARTM